MSKPRFYDRKVERLVKLIVSALCATDEALWRLGPPEQFRPRFRILVVPWRSATTVFRCELQILDTHECVQEKRELCPHWRSLRRLGLAHLDQLVRIEDELDIPFRDGMNGDYEGHSQAGTFVRFRGADPYPTLEPLTTWNEDDPAASGDRHRRKHPLDHLATGRALQPGEQAQERERLRIL